MRDLAAGRHRGRLLPRHVVRVAGVGQARSRVPLGLDEAERAAAHGLRDVRRRGHARQSLGHDEQAACRHLGEGVEQLGEGLVEADGEDAVARLRHLGHARHQRLAEGVARAPAADGGDAVAAAHRRVVVEAQALAQGEAPQQPVILDRVALDHLRADLEALVHAVELVVHQEGVVAGDEGGVGEGVDVPRVRVRRIAQDAVLRRLGESGGGDARGGNGPGGTQEKVAAVHG